MVSMEPEPTEAILMKSRSSAIAGTAMTLAFGVAAASAASLPVDVSGYELLLGSPCTINTESGTCNVAFSGWTGASGQTANGWTPFPGTGQGLWSATVNYIGRARFGGHVHVANGAFDLLFTDGTVVRGNVTSGKVEWPQEGQATVCGTDVATITMTVAFTQGPAGGGSFEGCLHDLPAGTINPPEIWGRLK
jgi:hypothetical protein